MKKTRREELVASCQTEEGRENYIVNQLIPHMARKQLGLFHSVQWEVDHTIREGMRAEMVLPNFWPLHVYRDHHQQEPREDDIEQFSFKGKIYDGIYLPDDGKPLPPGVIKPTNFDERAIRFGSKMERSEHQLGKNQLKDTIGGLRQFTHLEPGRKEAAAAVAPAPKRGSRKRRTAAPADDSDCDNEDVDFASAFNTMDAKSTMTMLGRHRPPKKEVVDPLSPAATTATPRPKEQKTRNSLTKPPKQPRQRSADDDWRKAASRQRKVHSIESLCVAGGHLRSQFESAGSIKTLTPLSAVDRWLATAATTLDPGGPVMGLLKDRFGK